MIKRLLGLLLAVLLMAAFYLYALLREDEQTKGREQWLVTAEETPLSPTGGLHSADPKALAQAMGIPLPLPAALDAGQVEDASFQWAYARLLTARSGELLVQGVRPASASPLIRPQGLSAFAPSGQTLDGYPLLVAEDHTFAYYYLATGPQGAFLLRAPKAQGPQALNTVALRAPE